MPDKCPVCNFAHKPEKWSICPCCGIEFGYEDSGRSYQELREVWLATGPVFWKEPQPEGWDWRKQLEGLSNDA